MLTTSADPRLWVSLTRMASEPPPPIREPPIATFRIVALIEVLICSDFPTQLAVDALLRAVGYGPFDAAGQLRVAYVVNLSLIDTVLLLAFVWMFLRAHDERPSDVFLGRRPVGGEIRLGLPLIFVALTLGVAVLLLVMRFAPQLHTVVRNPLQALLGSRRNAALFALVVIVAGGIREEVQRAFLLHRFEVWLGGGLAGVIATSIAFGAGHLLQGLDAAVTTGVLGAFWGLVYLWRRSIVAPMVSHAGFDLLQIFQAFAALSLRV